MDLSVREVNPDDTFQFQCHRCGECCHNVKESIMLTSWDLFRLAKHLNRPIEEVIVDYTVAVPIGGTLFPIFTLRTRPYGDTCIFYKNGCTVQDAKPQVCRLYPLNVHPGKHDGLDYFIVSQKPHHYTGETHKVGDWINANLTCDDRRFMIEWFNQALELGKLMQRIGTISNDMTIQERVLISFVWLMYTCYDTQEEFWPQYERNLAQLKKEMDYAARSGSC